MKLDALVFGQVLKDVVGNVGLGFNNLRFAQTLIFLTVIKIRLHLVNRR